MIVIGSNTSDNGKSRFTEDVSHFMELRQNRQIAKRSAKNGLTNTIKKVLKKCRQNGPLSCYDLTETADL